MRLGTANNYDNALQNLYTRQSELSSQQEKLTSGKNVNRASDDPIGAAIVERSLTRITRLGVEERALDIQRNAITAAESTLGEATEMLQNIREFVVGAGNGGYSPSDRSSLAKAMTGWRDQLFSLANRQDTNGAPLFGGLGSSSVPLTDVPGGVTSNSVGGQRGATEVTIPGTMDGRAIWMNVPTGNGTFDVKLGGTNAGTVLTDPGQVISPSALTGNAYSVTFSVVAGVTTYDVLNTTTSTPVAPASRPYVDGQAIQFDGMSFNAQGTPTNGDTLQISPSTQTNIFKILDDAITGIDGATAGNQLTQVIGLALAQIDSGMDRIQSARGQAGTWLNRADNISTVQSGRSVQLAADKSRAEDLDMVKGISDFQKIQTGYQAALQSYAQVQKLSLFNFIN